MTPEGRVKAKVDALLKDRAYRHKPVQNGMGAPALDYHVCCEGVYAAIETKAPGQWPTPRQTHTMKEVVKAKGALFLIRDEKDLEELRAWLSIPHRAFLNSTASVWLARQTSSESLETQSVPDA